MRHIGRVSFVPPRCRGHATNNLRDHFSFYMTLNILYLKKKIHTTWRKVIYPEEGQMLFNKRQSACLCSASNLLNLLPGREPARSHLCCEATRQAKNKLSAGPKLFKDIVCTCSSTAGKKEIVISLREAGMMIFPPAYLGIFPIFSIDVVVLEVLG